MSEIVDGNSELVPAAELLRFATACLTRAGMPEPRAADVAEVLVEGDLFGHTTHGLQLLSPYLKSIADGGMALKGEPEVVRDTGANFTWDGGFLPGPWLVRKAIAEARSRTADHGVVTAVIRRSHHIACLQAYLKPVTDSGRMILLTCSDPSVGGVAPFGGTRPLYTPNPLAAGIPTAGDPVLIDISMSATTIGRAMRTDKAGERLPGSWVMDAGGQPTDDPGVLFTDPPGSVLPLGGTDLGHKGFALGLLVEALTSALGGHGRADPQDRWGASVFVQLIDPDAFGGRDAFERETAWLANACHTNPPRDPANPVRLPGEAGLRRREAQLKRGVALDPQVRESLRKCADELGVAFGAG